MEPGTWKLVEVAPHRTVLADLELAVTFFSRLKGLQFRRPLPVGTGLLLLPCRSVHTAWMRFAIDVWLFDSDGVLLDVHRGVRPWRTASGPKGTRAVVEVLAGTTPEHLALRTRYAIQGEGMLPRCLRHWQSRGNG